MAGFWLGCARFIAGTLPDMLVPKVPGFQWLWKCALNDHVIFAPFSEVAQLLFCPGQESWLSMGRMAYCSVLLYGPWVFCQYLACGLLPGLVWWGFGIPVSLSDTSLPLVH